MSKCKILNTEQMLKALLDGRKIKHKNAPSGVNFYLEDGKLKSDKITHTKGIPMSFFNPDIYFEIDND